MHKSFKLNLSGFILNDNINISESFDNTNLQILIVNDEFSKNRLDPNHLYNKTCQKGEGELCKDCLYEKNDIFKCSKCNKGFYLPKDIIYPTKCKICSIENCEECYDNNICNKCKSGFELNNDKKKCNSIPPSIINSIPIPTTIENIPIKLITTIPKIIIIDNSTTLIPRTIPKKTISISTFPTTQITTIPITKKSTNPITIITVIPTTTFSNHKIINSTIPVNKIANISINKITSFPIKITTSIHNDYNLSNIII